MIRVSKQALKNKSDELTVQECGNMIHNMNPQAVDWLTALFSLNFLFCFER